MTTALGIRLSAECGWHWRSVPRRLRTYGRRARVIDGDYGRPYPERGTWFDGLGVILLRRTDSEAAWRSWQANRLRQFGTRS